MAVWQEVAEMSDRNSVITFEEAKERLGIKPMTNEQWLRSLDAEQLAKWIIDVTQYCFECGLNINNCLLCPFGKCGDVGSMVEWLKEIHNE